MPKALFIISYSSGANALGNCVGVVREEHEDPGSIGEEILNNPRTPFARWSTDSKTLITLLKREQKRLPAMRHESVIEHSYTGPARSPEIPVAKRSRNNAFPHQRIK